ncbi:tetratricopeptide repeat protein [Hydrogenophaga sp. UC242_50]|uniref:tetratricopeptide repeat protein n=2 Tax=unclassified Hydrogenophaga TaxID=2610897 RepID=UPI0036D33073
MTRSGVIGVAALLVCGLLSARADTGSEADWRREFEQASRHHAEGEYAKAEKAADRALHQALAGQGRTQPHVASSLNLLALIRQAQGQPEEAIALLREALGVNERALGVHPNTLAVAMNLGESLEAAGHLQEAMGLYERGLRMADTLHARTPRDESVHGWRQRALTALVDVHTELGQAAQAQVYNRRLLDEAEPASDAVRVAALTRQAQALQVEGRQEEAMALHRQALALRESNDPNDPALVLHYHALALWHAQSRDDAAAQAWFEKALAVVRTDRQGASRLAQAHILTSLAQLDERRGRYTDARRGYEASLLAYTGLGETPDAWLGRAQVLHQLAGVDLAQRRPADAEQRYLQALQLLERALGPDDPRLLPVLDNLMAYYTNRGQARQAMDHGQRASELRRAQIKGAP